MNKIFSFDNLCVQIYFQNDVEITIPKYFIMERLKPLKEREKVLGQILAKIGPQDLDKVYKTSLNIILFFQIMKEIFSLMTHSAHFTYSFMALGTW